MRYYPLNRVKTNQKTSGERFSLNGVPYKGLFYETYDGNYYTGPDPIQGPSQRLVEQTNPSLGGSSDRGTPAYSNPELVQADKAPVALTNLSTVLRNDLKTAFKEPKPYYPAPTDIDYKRGAFLRYFAKKRGRAGFVIEINKETYDSLQSVSSEYDYVTYEATSLFWQITGPLNDDRTNKQYKVAGIIDTNKRLVEAKEKNFIGLKAFIGEDYTKFAKPVGR